MSFADAPLEGIYVREIGTYITYGRLDGTGQPFVIINTEDAPDDDVADDGEPIIEVTLNNATLYDRERERCECDNNLVPGALWPMDTNGDNSHDWVERCDMCERFDNDDAAARAVAAKVGGIVNYAMAWGVSSPCPYVEKEY